MSTADEQLLDSVAARSSWSYIDLDSIVLLNVTLRGIMMMIVMVMRTTAAAAALKE
jgi:hypothetical protein